MCFRRKYPKNKNAVPTCVYAGPEYFERRARAQREREAADNEAEANNGAVTENETVTENGAEVKNDAADNGETVDNGADEGFDFNGDAGAKDGGNTCAPDEKVPEPILEMPVYAGPPESYYDDSDDDLDAYAKEVARANADASAKDSADNDDNSSFNETPMRLVYGGSGYFARRSQKPVSERRFRLDDDDPTIARQVYAAPVYNQGKGRKLPPASIKRKDRKAGKGVKEPAGTDAGAQDTQNTQNTPNNQNTQIL